MTRQQGFVAIVLLLALALLAVLRGIAVTTDMSVFVPQQGPGQEPLLLDQLRRGSSSRVVMLAVDGDLPEPQLARLSSELAASLRQDSRLVQVLNGELALATAAQGLWFDYRYLLQPVDLSEEALRRSLAQRLEELRGPLGFYTRRTLATDPTAAYLSMLRRWQGESQPQRRHGVWFADDGRALLFAVTAADGFDLDAQQENVAAIHQAFAGLNGAEQASLLVTGAPALAVASRETIRSEAQLAGIAATLAVALILLIAYRSLRLWLLSALPLAGAVVVALAATAQLFGSIHGITIAFGVTLLGVAIDYPVHLFSHLRRGEAPQHSLTRVWPTLRLGVASTLIGFAALLFTRFEGLMQLGVFAVSGLLAAALITRFILPGLLPQSWQGREVGRPAEPSTVLAAWRLPLVALLLLLAAVYLALSGRPLWERDLAALSPVPAAQLQQERALREALPVSDLNRVLLMQAESVEALLQTQERLLPTMQQWLDEGLLEGFTLAAERLPSRARQLQRQQALPDAAVLKRRLAHATAGMPFREGALSPFVEAVARSASLPPLTRQQVRNTPEGLALDGLMFERDGRWWGVVQLAGLHDAEALQARIGALDAVLRYVDLKQETGSLLDGFREAALAKLVWGALLIVLLLAVATRSPHRLIRVVLPLSAAIAVTLALQHALGERLSLFHLTSLLLVAGIGIDYGLFFSRRDSVSERGRTLHALSVCATSTVTVFAILALSQLPVLHAIGSTVLIGVSAAYLLARFAGSGSTPGGPQRDDDV